MLNFLSQARKFVVALAGAAAVAVTAGLLSGDLERWVTGILAAVTAALVYLISNETPVVPAVAVVVVPDPPATPAGP